MVAFGDITSWKPGAGQVTTWTATAASRALVRQAARDPLPPSPQQAQHLRNAHRCAALGLPMPRLLISAWNVAGVCDPVAMTAAINGHVRCQDTYHSAFAIHDDDIVRRTIGDPSAIEFTPHTEGFMDDEQIYRHVLTTTPATSEWDCFTFGVIQHAEHFTFYASVDHLHFDGMSIAGLFTDIHYGYQARVHGLPDPVLHDSDYRGHTRRQHQRSAALTLQSPEVQTWIEFANDGPWPTFPLPTGDTPLVGPGIFVTEDLLDAQQTEAFASACRAAGARFSGGVLACAALTDHRFTGSAAYRALTPADTRGRDVHSVGWFASLFPISVPIGDGEFDGVARAAQTSFDANRMLAGVPFTRAGELAAAGGIGVSVPSSPPMMVSFMDLRDDVMAALLQGDGPGMFADPLSGGGVNVWINRYRTGTSVTLSLPDTPAAAASARRYIAELRSTFVAAADRAGCTAAPTEGR